MESDHICERTLPELEMRFADQRTAAPLQLRPGLQEIEECPHFRHKKKRRPKAPLNIDCFVV
jgi:hypothetical protein